MKCPWCLREIGLPPVRRQFAKCPYCAGQVTYAFRLRSVALYLFACGIAAALLLPFTGALVILVALVVPFIASAYLEKWY